MERGKKSEFQRKISLDWYQTVSNMFEKEHTIANKSKIITITSNIIQW
jgi:hypothetical protein